MRFLLIFLAPHPVPPRQQPRVILRFTHHIQTIKFSLVYRVAIHMVAGHFIWLQDRRKGLLAAERLRTPDCYDNFASTYFRKSELKRCCCCHV